jgi:hypothetical protein
LLDAGIARSNKDVRPFTSPTLSDSRASDHAEFAQPLSQQSISRQSSQQSLQPSASEVFPVQLDTSIIPHAKFKARSKRTGTGGGAFMNVNRDRVSRSIRILQGSTNGTDKGFVQGSVSRPRSPNSPKPSSEAGGFAVSVPVSPQQLSSPFSPHILELAAQTELAGNSPPLPPVHTSRMTTPSDGKRRIGSKVVIERQRVPVNMTSPSLDSVASPLRREGGVQLATRISVSAKQKKTAVPFRQGNFPKGHVHFGPQRLASGGPTSVVAALRKNIQPVF